MEIHFGVMTSVWKIEAEDLLVGKIAMMVFIGKQLPIVIYFPEDKEQVFRPSVDFINKNMNYKPEEVKKALDTIKKITKGGGS